MDATNDRVGINKTPSVELDVSGNAVISGDLTVNSNVQIAAAGVLEFAYDSTGKEIAAGMIGYDKFSSSALSIVGSGVLGAARAVRIWDMLGVNKVPIYTLDVSGNTAISGNTTVSGSFGVNTSTLFVDASTANVGIRNINPQYALDVDGNAAINGNTTVSGSFGVNTDTLFVDAFTTNVGIRNINPQYALDVGGDAAIHGGVEVINTDHDIPIIKTVFKVEDNGDTTINGFPRHDTIYNYTYYALTYINSGFKSDRSVFLTSNASGTSFAETLGIVDASDFDEISAYAYIRQTFTIFCFFKITYPDSLDRTNKYLILDLGGGFGLSILLVSESNTWKLKLSAKNGSNDQFTVEVDIESLISENHFIQIRNIWSATNKYSLFQIYYNDTLELNELIYRNNDSKVIFGSDACGFGGQGGGGWLDPDTFETASGGVENIVLSAGSFVAYIDEQFIDNPLANFYTLLNADTANEQVSIQGSLDVSGRITTETGITNNSDDRIKSNETLIENSTATLMKLTPQLYDQYSSFDHTGTPIKNAGLVAQEIYYQAPELRDMVSLNKDQSGKDIIPYEYDLSNNDLQNDPDYTALNWGDRPVAVNYTYLIPYLVKSNQEQQMEIEELKTKLNMLTERLTNLEGK